MRVVLDVLKSSIFVVQKLALHQNGVEFRQQSIGDIRSSVTTLYDVLRRRATKSKFSVYILTHSRTHSQSHVWRQACCLKILSVALLSQASVVVDQRNLRDFHWKNCCDLLTQCVLFYVIANLHQHSKGKLIS